MKNLELTKILWIALAFFTLAFDLSAQKIALTGRLRTPGDAAVRDAEVLIYDVRTNTLVDRCYSDAAGVFISGKVLEKGQQIRVEISADNFSTFKKNYTIKTGKAGKIVLSPLAGNGTGGAGGSGLRIKGTVKADQVELVKNAIVSFYYTGEEEMTDNGLTNEKGEFQSAPRFKKGDVITVVVKKNGYGEARKEVEFRENRDVKVDFIMTTRTFIAGFVADARTGQSLQGVSISYQSKEGPFIEAIKTNSNGYFDFDVPAPFIPGDKITIRAEKEEKEEKNRYVPEEKTHIITLAENRLNFVIQKWADKGVDMGIRVQNKKGKPMPGVEIRYFDIDTNKIITPDNGLVKMNIKKAPGDKVQFQLLKSGYKLETPFHTLSKEFQIIDIKMEKDGSKCPCWLYTALGLTAASGTAYGLYSASYNDYKDFKNLNRETDYDKSTTWLRVGTVAGGLALGAFIGWTVCLSKEAKRNREADRLMKRQSFVPLVPSGDSPQFIQIGIAYQF